jgi:hypothetical protein
VAHCLARSGYRSPKDCPGFGRAGLTISADYCVGVAPAGI